ncbi:MAG: PorV/PorQ family protein [Elusimicrobia bacterium]|nr:PorV/PorQ family protein [Elusimicrobiota bacterium]
MRTSRLAALCAAALWWAGPASAGSMSSGGGEVLEFLSLDAGGRSVAMGGAYTALASDANSLLYNPAGLGRIDGYQSTFMHNQFVQGITHDYFGLAAKQGFGAQVDYLHFGDIPRTTLSSPDGAGSRIEVSDLALGVGYGRKVYEGLSLGVGLKYLRESVESVAGHGLAGDIGALYVPKAVPGLAVGASLLNIGPPIHYQGLDQKLPLSLRLGAAYAFPLLGNQNTVAFDLVKPRTDRVRYAVGVETVFARMVAFRMGFNTSNGTDLGISGGVGKIGRNLSVDYAITPYGDLGISHSATFSFRWGGSEGESDPAAPGAPRPASLAPGTADEHFARAEAHFDRGAYHRAQEELGAAFALLPPEDSRRVWYHERLGTIAARKGDCAGAKGRFSEAIRIAGNLQHKDAHLADAYAGLGACLVLEKNQQFGVRFLKKALEVGPSPKTRASVERQLEELQTAD